MFLKILLKSRSWHKALLPISKEQVFSKAKSNPRALVHKQGSEVQQQDSL